MRFCGLILAVLLIPMVPPGYAAEEDGIVNIGNAEIFHDYRQTERGTAILTLNAVVSETNDSLRGLKNTDQRRLRKLGQLIYQCRLMLYRPDNKSAVADVNDPVLISKNYSLFTGVDVALETDERVGIQARALRAVEENSLFTPLLGSKPAQEARWETLGEGAALNLRQLDVNVLGDSDLIETSESIDFTIRFPVFQLKKPVNQWNYSFNLKDFKKAQRYIDDNCTPVRLVELINRNG